MPTKVITMLVLFILFNYGYKCIIFFLLCGPAPIFTIEYSKCYNFLKLYAAHYKIYYPVAACKMKSKQFL